jgi:Domain of unknown function (DUF222)/HNH endonuclease
VLDAVEKAACELQSELAVFDLSSRSGPQCMSIVETLARTEKACAAARALAAARAIELGSIRAQGFASGPEWLAQQMGSTSGEARLAIETAATVNSCPEVKHALVAGELSLAQAHEIARSQPELPGTEHDLVDLARRSGLGAVRDAVRDRLLQQADSAKLYELQRRKRAFHHWRDRDGMVRLAAAFTPDVGIPIVNRLEEDAERRRAEARRSGEEEPFPAHACDALAALLTGPGRQVPDGEGRARSRPTRTELVLVCDLNAYRRGHAHPGEACHVRGGGPLPVERVRELSEDAFIKAVLHDGVRIETVKHFGRHISAELRTALELGLPPGFEGAVCAEPGCGRRYGLEWDHVDPVAHGGPTSYQNLQPRCWPHHRHKTEGDRAAGLLTPAPT